MPKRLKINLRSDILNAVGITLDETTTRENVMQLFSVLLGDNHGLEIDTLDKDVAHDSRSIQPAIIATTKSSLIRCLIATTAKPK
ncbi:hypothetical protein ACLK1U_16400 [Escherichia coli]